MNTDTLTCAIIGHLVGDYLLQNDWMACNKKRPGPHGNTACVVHCAIWSMCVLLFSGWYHAQNLFLVCAVLFLTHYAQDRTQIIVWWMNLIQQRRFMQTDRLDMITFDIIPGLGPWSVIVVDNVWHIVTLWAVWRWIV